MRPAMSLLARLQLVGTVTSQPTHMERTAKVMVTRLVRHPVVGKVRALRCNTRVEGRGARGTCEKRRKGSEGREGERENRMWYVIRFLMGEKALDRASTWQDAIDRR